MTADHLRLIVNFPRPPSPLVVSLTSLPVEGVLFELAALLVAVASAQAPGRLRDLLEASVGSDSAPTNDPFAFTCRSPWPSRWNGPRRIVWESVSGAAFERSTGKPSPSLQEGLGPD